MLFLFRKGVLCLWVLAASSVPAQVVNTWTNPVSEKWESNSWSLGKLPASGQAVEITNSGYKAVNIDSATVANFPSSLTIDSLEVDAPKYGLSTLLLNSFGLNTPLKVLGSCILWTNGTLLNLYSSLEIDGAGDRAFVMYGGTFIQEGGLTVLPPVQLETGTINATNATMNLGPLYMRYGKVYQSGGTVLTRGMQMDYGAYTLLENGTLYVLDKTVLTGVFARFDHISGTNFGDVLIQDGFYHLYQGYLRGNTWRLAGYGSFLHHDGTAEFTTMQAYGGQGGPNYRIDAGTLRCGTLDIAGMFTQYGGTVFLTNRLYMSAGLYQLVGGTVFMPSMVVTGGVFQHLVGTNNVAGDVALYNTDMEFEGGRFSSANLGVGPGANLGQESGSNVISGVLSISGNYYLSGGFLSLNGLYLRGSLTVASSYVNPPPLFLNTGLINFGGTLNISTSESSIGQLGLSTNGTINLGASSLVVRFADSSTLDWDSNARLVIAGWRGSYSGTGANQVYFGNSNSGLTASQLSQVRFRDPAGTPLGSYNAQILSSGEVVPLLPPSLQTLRSGNQLVLTWSGNYQLLTATNVLGPFELLSGAASPYTNDIRTAPHRFFILQGQ